MQHRLAYLQDVFIFICYAVFMNWNDIKIFLQVARTQRLSAAALSLNVDSSTVSRRLHQLEKDLQVRLFERGADGHQLTEQGLQLLQSSQLMEQTFQGCVAQLQGGDLELSGSVKLGTTEAFGSFFVVPNMAAFNQQHQQIHVEILPLPRVIKLSQHEADIAITIGKPRNTSYIVNKLTDYRLRLYASKHYLRQHSIHSFDDLAQQRWIGYVDSMDFNQQLSFLHDIFPQVQPVIKSSSAVAQYMAVKNGLGIAILPCFMAESDPDLQCLFVDEIDITRDFYLVAHPDNKHIKRVEMLWDYLKEQARLNNKLLMGELS